MSPVAVMVNVGESEFQLDDDSSAPFTFGRASTCTLCLDPDDIGISRMAGKVEYDGRTWWLTNTSATRSLDVVTDLGLRSVLPPGRRVPLDEALTAVVVGQIRRHAVEITPPEALADPQSEDQPGQETLLGDEVKLNDQDKLALLAMFEGYLQPFPRTDPNPASYTDAAARLGWRRTTLVKRVEYIKVRYSRAGVAALIGDHALRQLAEHVLTTGEISRADLPLLDRSG